jgi:hypothetical protein
LNALAGGGHFLSGLRGRRAEKFFGIRDDELEILHSLSLETSFCASDMTASNRYTFTS